MTLGDVPQASHAVAVRTFPDSAAALRRYAASSQAGRWAALAALAVALGGLYAVLVESAIWLRQPSGGALFYLPEGLALAVLVLTPLSTWPLWLVMFAGAHIGVDQLHGPLAPVVGFTVANMVDPVVGALLLAAALRRWRGPRAALVSFAAFPVVLAPLLGSLVATSTYMLTSLGHKTWWEVMWPWWVGDALGVLVTGSVILAWARPVPSDGPVPLAPVAAVAAVGAGAIVASGVVWHYPLVYVVLPCLVWAGFVGGVRAMTAVGAAAALAADWVAITARAGRLLASPGKGEQLVLLQLFLGVTFLTGLVLAVEIGERRRHEQRARDAEVAAVKVAEAERHSLAQDTHDIVGHGLNVMLLQLGAVRLLFDEDPMTARELVASAESIGRKACDDLDVSLAVVGTGSDGTTGKGIESAAELVETLRKAGLRVDLTVEGERGDVPTLVDWSAYRILREALTNVLKHAPSASATVTIHYDEHALSLSVLDDGGRRNGAAAPSRDGQGVIGMRERAAALGGTLDVGPNPRGGFKVNATLPIARR